MKSFAILLIILNIGFFTWLQGWLDWMPWQPQDIVPPTQIAKPSKSDLPTLALLNEKTEKPVEKPLTVATAEQAKPEVVKPEVKAEPPKTVKPEPVAPAVVEKVTPVEKPVVAAETVKTPEPAKPEPVKVEKPAPIATVEAPKVAVTEAAKTEKVEPAAVKTEAAKPVENLASVAKPNNAAPNPDVKEIKTSEKSEAMQIPPPAVITPENNPITTFISKIKPAVASSSSDKPSDTGISAPPKAETKEAAIEQTATPTTTVLNALPAEVLNAMNATKAEPPVEAKVPATPTTPAEAATEKTTQSSNSSSTLAKNSATIPSSSPVAEGSMKSLQAVKKEDKTSLKLNNSSELCFVAGPYPLLSNAQSSAKWFRSKSKVQAEIQADDVPTVFWVYLPPYKNQKEANRQAQHLAHLGITDYVLVTTGKLKHAISLGVYRDQASAQRRVDELHRKGYKRARLEKQRQGNKRYWLSVKMPATQKDLMVSFKRAQKISAIEVNVCE